MNMKLVILTFIVILSSMCMGSPISPVENGKLKAQSLLRRALLLGPVGSEKAVQTQAERMERMASLPEDQREFMSKQILQALSEIIQRDDCMSDYQGWVDFGRRNTD